MLSPDSSLSGENGTIIFLSYSFSPSFACIERATPLLPPSIEKSHFPLRFCQVSRMNCGFGCSLLGIFIFEVLAFLFLI
jgi:hypothetical protein